MAMYVGLLNPESRTTAATSNVVTVSEKYSAAHIVIDVTAGTGFNLVFNVKGKDPLSGKAYTLVSTPTINTTGTTIVRVGPEFTAGTNVAKDYIPYYFFVDTTVSGTVAATYSVSASLM